MAPSAANQYIRQVIHHNEAPPPVTARFFYTSTLAIDDPLSPLPPPIITGSAPNRQPPHPFSEYDNDALDKAWHGLRREILQYHEEQGEKPKPAFADTFEDIKETKKQEKGKGRKDDIMKYGGRPASRSDASSTSRSAATLLNQNPKTAISANWDDRTDLKTSLAALDGPALPAADVEASNTTGNPFVRAPSRKVEQIQQISRESLRPEPHMIDSYNWGDRTGLLGLSRPEKPPPGTKEPQGPTKKVAVGVSRLHNVAMPDLQMEPIYWHPVNDISPVMRGTWFYKDTMLPVETAIANMLELGYVELKPWTETWTDELNSAVEVGAAGEMKIIHRLWPESAKRKDISRPGTAAARAEMVEVLSTADLSSDTPEKEFERAVEAACDLIDISTGADGPDNKASGTATYGYNGTLRTYSLAGVIYANEKEAHILKPNLQPSTYYGRRPFANYIRKGRKLGIPVVRGFDQAIWDRLHPPTKSAAMKKAQEGVSSSQSGAPPSKRAKSDPELAMSERPKVTDLVLVIHGIGQKLSERMESFHFTHAINAFRREVGVELGTDGVKGRLRKDMGGIMVLPVSLAFAIADQ